MGAGPGRAAGKAGRASRGHAAEGGSGSGRGRGTGLRGRAGNRRRSRALHRAERSRGTRSRSGTGSRHAALHAEPEAGRRSGHPGHQGVPLRGRGRRQGGGLLLRLAVPPAAPPSRALPAGHGPAARPAAHALAGSWRAWARRTRWPPTSPSSGGTTASTRSSPPCTRPSACRSSRRCGPSPAMPSRRRRRRPGRRRITPRSIAMIKAAEEDGGQGPAFWTAEVVQLEHRADKIAVLTLAPDQPFRLTRASIDGADAAMAACMAARTPMACTPRDDGLLTLHVQAVSGRLGEHCPGVAHRARRRARPRAAAGDHEPGPRGGPGPAVHRRRHRPVPAEGHHRAGHPGLRGEPAADLPLLRSPAAQELYDLPDLWHLADACDSLQVIPSRPTILPSTACRGTSAGSPPGTCRTGTARPTWPAGPPWSARHFACCPGRHPP